MAKSAEFTCQVMGSDRIEISHDSMTPLGRRQPLLRFFVDSDNGAGSAYLNTEQVRELFNFMGVWLHTQAEG